MIADRLEAFPKRRGFGLVEMAVACVLFATIVVIAAQLVSWVATDRKSTTRRQEATQLVGNVMERVLARPWSAMTTEALTPLTRSKTETNPIAGFLAIEVTQAPAIDGRGVKKITIEVRWPDRSKVAESPVRLIAWTFEPRGGQP